MMMTLPQDDDRIPAGRKSRPNLGPCPIGMTAAAVAAMAFGPWLVLMRNCLHDAPCWRHHSMACSFPKPRCLPWS